MQTPGENIWNLKSLDITAPELMDPDESMVRILVSPPTTTDWVTFLFVSLGNQDMDDRDESGGPTDPAGSRVFGLVVSDLRRAYPKGKTQDTSMNFFCSIRFSIRLAKD